jgi:hypothetical protein
LLSLAADNQLYSSLEVKIIEMEVIIYILVAVGIYLFKMISENSKKYKDSRPNMSGRPKQGQRELKSLEDLLSEFSQDQSQKPEEPATQPERRLFEGRTESVKPLKKESKPAAPTFPEKNKYQKAYENLEQKEMEQMDNEIESTRFEGSKKYRPLKAYRTKKRFKDNYKAKSSYKKGAKKEKSAIQKLLSSKDGQRNAIILSEILNNPYKDQGY